MCETGTEDHRGLGKTGGGRGDEVVVGRNKGVPVGVCARAYDGKAKKEKKKRL